tara:strand:- start:2307 stop:2636 length:330 start_codon:yes stop_codon:yes gene_type:complete
VERRDDKKTEITEVTIFGREYPLHSDESDDYTRNVAQFVDKRMYEIASEQNLADPTRIAILAAMDIADRLLKKRNARAVGEDRTSQAINRLANVMEKDTDSGNAETQNK